MTKSGSVETDTTVDLRDATIPVSRYRADIDGLRALAVSAVILAHAQIAGFDGGFVGVDVFFVISGYLIYRDLTTRVAAGRLALLGFYGRRTRRTLPALYLVGLATLAAATFVKVPGELDEIARSLVAAVLLVPNIFFYQTSGYFEVLASTKPLLHTWSLGVEEQFYLLAPVLPLAIRRLAPSGRKVVLAALFAIALAVTLRMQATSPTAAFYLMPARIFEFLIGAAIVEGLFPTIRWPWVAEAVTLAALVALAVSIHVFSDDTPHPSWPVLVPCLATAAIIHVGSARTTLAARLLGLRVPAFLGLISYSLYLWHWPILVLSGAMGIAPTWAVLALEAVLVFGLSVLSWRFVETPFRRPGSIWRARAPVLLPLGAACVLGCAFAIIALRGLPQRFTPEIASVASYYTYRDTRPFREGTCFVTSRSVAGGFDPATCLHIATDKPNVLLFGDSHAAHLWTGLRDTWPEINVLQATASGCKPVFDTTGPSRCVAIMDEMLRSFIPQHHLDALVIAGLWEPDDVEPLKQTVAALKPYVGRVVVFGPVPRYHEFLATLLARGMIHGNPEEAWQRLREGTDALDTQMRSAISPVATYVSPYRLLCPGDHCRLFAAPGVPMQFDYHHLTPQGADILMAAVRATHPNLFGSR